MIYSIQYLATTIMSVACIVVSVHVYQYVPAHTYL